jgi:2,3-bisphosphoglycerate-dependent phosphoglycerate mutase
MMKIPTLVCLLFLRCGFSQEGQTTHFYFVRHGETHRNQQGERISGQEDGPIAQLNDTGRMQADMVGKQLAEQLADQILWIYTSPLGRALETATIIAGYFPKATLTKEPRLMEYNHGRYDTIRFQLRNQLCLAKYEEIERQGIPLDRFYKWKLRWSDLIEYNPNLTETPLEGTPENALEVFERVTHVIEELSEKHQGQKILLVTHAGIIKTMIIEAENRDKEGPLPMYFESAPSTSHLPSNCSVTHFEKKENTPLLLIKNKNTDTETVSKKQ